MIPHKHRAQLDRSHPAPQKGVTYFALHTEDPDASLRRQLREEIGKALKPWGIHTTRPDTVLLDEASRTIWRHFWDTFRMAVIVRPGDTLGEAVEKTIQAIRGRGATTRG